MDGKEIDRFLLADGDAVTVGRASLDAASPLGQLVAAGKLAGLSREHAVLQARGKNLIVRDAGSSGGTTIRPWNNQRKKHGISERLSEGVPRKVGLRDQITLGDVLTIERSGKTIADAHSLRVGVPSSALADGPTVTD